MGSDILKRISSALSLYGSTQTHLFDMGLPLRKMADTVQYFALIFNFHINGRYHQHHHWKMVEQKTSCFGFGFENSDLWALPCAGYGDILLQYLTYLSFGPVRM